MKVLVGIDPGLATGICVINIDDLDNPVPLEDAELDLVGYYRKIEELAEKYGDDMEMVIESFIITPKTAKLSQAPWSLENIGVARFIGGKYGIPITFQKPADKPFASNERLRKVGFWVVGSEGHSNDAYRHCMIWIANTNPNWTKKLIL